MGRGRDVGRRADRGAAAVEFALIAPLLLFLLFAIIGYGYMLSFRQALSQGAAEGAREAAVAPSGYADADRIADARSAVDDSLDSYGITCVGDNLMRNGTDVGTCEVTLDTCGSNECVNVELGYAYSDHALVPVPGLGIVLPDNLSYTASARVS